MKKLRTYQRSAWAFRFAHRYADEHNHLMSIRPNYKGEYEVWDEGKLPEPPAGGEE